MPITYTDCTMPSGKAYLRVDVSGRIELEVAETIGVRLREQRTVHHGKVMCVVAKGTVYSPQARKYFNTITHDHTGMAVVMTSAIVRAAINMMMRLVPDPGNVRMFNDEVAALAWLEQQ